MNPHTSHLLPDGSTFPPVTPAPPGYVDPLEGLDRALEGDRSAAAKIGTEAAVEGDAGSGD